MILTIAISCLVSPNNNELEIIEQVNNFKKYIPIKIKKEIEIIFVIQCEEIKDFELLKKKMNTKIKNFKLKFIYGGKKGVAISRNIAIQNAQSRYLLFFDLDCRFNEELSNLIHFLNSLGSEIKYIYLVNTNNYIGNNYSILPRIKNVPQKPKLFYKFVFALISIMKSPTYNIIVCPNYCKKYQIFFDKNLGLGSYYRQSDEALFLINLFTSLNKNKLEIENYFSADFINAESKSHLKREEIFFSLQSKGYVIRKGFNILFGSILILPFTLFFIFKLIKNINPLKVFFLIFKGFLFPKY